MESSITLDAALHESVSHIHALLSACELLYKHGGASRESLKLIEDALLFVYYRDKTDLEVWRASARTMMRKRGFPVELLDTEQGLPDAR